MTAESPSPGRIWRQGPWLAGVLLALPVFLLIFLNNPGLAGREDSGRRDALAPAELAGLQEGDIILRKGVGLPSDVIATVLGEGLNISHCGLVVIPQNEHIRRIPAGRISFSAEGGSVQAGRPAVIHTINSGLSGVDGVQIQDLAHFNTYSSERSVVILRPRIGLEQRAGLVAAAWSQLQAAIPFDNAYDQSDPSSLYCSELLFHIFKEAGWDVASAQVYVMGVLGFGSFLDPDYWQVVYSHNPAIY